MASSSGTSNRMLYAGGSLLAVLLMVGGLGWQLGWFGGETSGLRVETEKAQRRTITQTVTAFGRAKPEVKVTITPDVPGEIVALPVQEGDVVQKGDLLARLKPDDYQAAVERAQAQVSEAKATLAQRRADSIQARRTFERKKKLYEKGVIPESKFYDAKTSYTQAKARLEAAHFRVESAKADLRDAREQLQKTRLYAPMNGTVSKLTVEVGERVVGTQQRSGTKMMNIARLDRMELKVDVNENDVINVAGGDTARVEFDAYPDRSFQGKVTEIANAARIQNQGSQNEVTNFPVTIRILGNPNAGPAATRAGGGLARPERPAESGAGPVIRPGMSGSVDIYTETVNDAVAVPIQAVTVRDFNEVGPGADTTKQKQSAEEDLRKVVFVAEADSARMVEVTTGIADDTYMEIKSGLEGGETVITGPYSAVSRELEQGDKIQTRSGGSQAGGPLATTQ
ncbi:MAG: efflux RND transporter periplasmic adaptor subunit [Salinibacter sp.]|uniref:efflux RND transporter periplasmic adaptor subunit n=1 Tax=Salinibacter sp. TaxID=2065818 RepID=UPI0035D458D4